MNLLHLHLSVCTMKKFYNDNQNKKIKNLTELNLNILDFIDLTNFLENQLI